MKNITKGAKEFGDGFISGIISVGLIVGFVIGFACFTAQLSTLIATNPEINISGVISSGILLIIILSIGLIIYFKT